MVTSRSALRTFIKQHEPLTSLIQATDQWSLYVKFADSSSKPTDEAKELYGCKPVDEGYIYTLQTLAEHFPSRFASLGQVIAQSGAAEARAFLLPSASKAFPKTLASALSRLVQYGISPKKMNNFVSATPQEIAKSYGYKSENVVIGTTNSGVSKYTVLELDLREFASAKQFIKVPERLESLEAYRNMSGCTYIADIAENRLFLIYRTGRVSTRNLQQDRNILAERDWLVAYAAMMKEWIMNKATDADEIIADIKEAENNWIGEPEAWAKTLTI